MTCQGIEPVFFNYTTVQRHMLTCPTLRRYFHPLYELCYTCYEYVND